ncbi:MAG: hypothetical protein QOI66_3670, partial [Myxococcales bacterium]|nr:hypothetical protein [Myxococcales bacterium]
MITLPKNRLARPTLAIVALGAVELFVGGACSDAMHEVGINPMPDAGADSAPPSPPVTIPADDLAKRLAKLIWNTTPDAALTASATMARTQADVGALARQMLQDGRARAGVGAFYRWWLNLDMVSMV